MPYDGNVGDGLSNHCYSGINESENNIDTEAEEKSMRVKEFLMEEDGIGVVEVLLILVVLIGLVLIFKKQITKLVENIFKTIQDQAGEV